MLVGGGGEEDGGQPSEAATVTLPDLTKHASLSLLLSAEQLHAINKKGQKKGRVGLLKLALMHSVTALPSVVKLSSPPHCTEALH